MEAAVIVFGHIIALAIGYALGKVKGFSDAQPQRDKRGKFTKRS